MGDACARTCDMKWKGLPLPGLHTSLGSSISASLHRRASVRGLITAPTISPVVIPGAAESISPWKFMRNLSDTAHSGAQRPPLASARRLRTPRMASGASSGATSAALYVCFR